MLQTILLTSLIITGLHVAMLPDMIFRFVREFEMDLPEWLIKPLYDCLPCMSGLWGTIIFLFTDVHFHLYPAFILAVCGVNTIISMIIRLGTNEHHGI